MLASEEGHIEAVEILISKGANINAVDNDGNTALMDASGKRDAKTTEFFVAMGLDVNAFDNYRESELMDARRRLTQIVELLIENGADVNFANSNGVTALIWASRGGHIETIKVLISKSADVNSKDKNGKTALTYALLKENSKIVNLLKASGAN